MLEFSAKIILIGSIFGMGFIILRKIPALVSLPVVETEKRQSFSFSDFLKNKVNPKSRADFLRKMVVEKGLTGVKKLNREQKKSKLEDRKVDFSDDYWQKIRRGE